MRRYPTDRESLERDCTIDFYRGSGPGGQHRNKRETAVRLTHTPSGLVVTATEQRSQSSNREQAFERMATALIRRQRRKRKRIKTKPTRGSIRRRLTGKKEQGQKKSLRRKPSIRRDD
ncbi:MAG: protein subunit release factor B [Myxococcota bacterium]|jgi:protein subunit release factor B